MSAENFRNFYASIVEKDEELKGKLKAAATADEFMAIAAPLAKGAGLDFTVQDVMFVLQGEELKDEELAGVAGGVASFPIVAGAKTKPSGKCTLLSRTGDCCYDW